MASPERDKDGRQKKRKAEHSPLLHTLFGVPRLVLLELQLAPKPSNFDYPNTVPVIFRDADPKFQSNKQVMRELSQYHTELRVSRVKDLPTRGFFRIENTPRDVIILQSEIKLKACLGQNVKISLPKAYQMKEKNKTIVVKGVPTEFTDDEFKEILDLNTIQYAKV